jgi:hypothetical protein
MVWIAMQNGSGQVVKDIRVESPTGDEYIVTKSKRVGINRYEISLSGVTNNNSYTVMNHVLKSWKVCGEFHTPETLAKMFNRPLDPDANKPRKDRRSFWAMRSKPGTINYKQKKRLIETQYEQYKQFEDLWQINLDYIDSM